MGNMKGGENLLERRNVTVIDSSRILLIAQMKRVIELLEKQNPERMIYSRDLAELDNKLHEIRRDSIRLMKMVRSPYEIKKECP